MWRAGKRRGERFRECTHLAGEFRVKVGHVDGPALARRDELRYILHAKDLVPVQRLVLVLVPERMRFDVGSTLRVTSEAVRDLPLEELPQEVFGLGAHRRRELEGIAEDLI